MLSAISFNSSQFMAVERCVQKVHHFVTSKPVLVWQSCQSLLHTPLSGWLLFLLWWQISVSRWFVNSVGIHCLWGNATDKNLGGLRSGEWGGQFHIAFSAHKSFFKVLPQPSNGSVGNMRFGFVWNLGTSPQLRLLLVCPENHNFNGITLRTTGFQEGYRHFESHHRAIYTFYLLFLVRNEYGLF